MIRKKLQILTLLLVCISLSAQPVINDITFDGLHKTDESYLLKFLKVDEGLKLDTNALNEEEIFLKNTLFFSDANCEVVKNEDNTVDLIFHVNEKRTLLPIVNFNIIEDNYLIRLGAVEYNLFGYWNKLGGYYQHYDRDSFQIYWQSSHLFGSRFGFSSRYLKNSTTEPAYFGNGIAYYDVDKNSTEILIAYDLSQYIYRNPKISISGGVDYLTETYKKNYDESGENSPGVDLDEREKWIYKFNFSYSNVDYDFEYLSGIKNRTFYDLVSEKGDAMGFHKVLTEFILYEKFWNKFNFAGRVRFGLSTNKDSPFIPFVIDNYLNVRGAGERIDRGSAELSVNFEIRASILQYNWSAVQLVGFYDYSSLRPGGGGFSFSLDDEHTAATTGFGIRAHLFDFYNVIFRFDYGFSINEFSRNGFVIGLGQFF